MNWGFWFYLKANPFTIEKISSLGREAWTMSQKKIEAIPFFEYRRLSKGLKKLEGTFTCPECPDQPLLFVIAVEPAISGRKLLEKDRECVVECPLCRKRFRGIYE